MYREAGLTLRRKKRKHCVRQSAPLRQYTAANQEWALDFVHDAIAAGRAIRVLSVVDAYTRECLALEVDTSFASRRVTRVLDQIIEQRGAPRSIRCDNGPELTSRHFLAWCIERKIELVHIQPGKPTQNAHLESFHGRLREECLRISWFQNLFDARRKIAIFGRRPRPDCVPQLAEHTRPVMRACAGLHPHQARRLLREGAEPPRSALTSDAVPLDPPCLLHVPERPASAISSPIVVAFVTVRPPES